MSPQIKTTTEPPPTTTSTTSTTTTTTTTTTAEPPPPSIEEFITAYAAATEGGDSQFLTERLLPEIRDTFGEELCRSWVDEEILLISGYTLTGEPTGPFSRSLNIADSTIEVEQYFEAQVNFMFQGGSFDTTATFVVRDGVVYWIGECR